MEMAMKNEHYKKLLLMAVLSFISMYAMVVNTFANVFLNQYLRQSASRNWFEK